MVDHTQPHTVSSRDQNQKPPSSILKAKQSAMVSLLPAPLTQKQWQAKASVLRQSQRVAWLAPANNAARYEQRAQWLQNECAQTWQKVLQHGWQHCWQQGCTRVRARRRGSCDLPGSRNCRPGAQAPSARHSGQRSVVVRVVVVVVHVRNALGVKLDELANLQALDLGDLVDDAPAHCARTRPRQ